MVFALLIGGDHLEPRHLVSRPAGLELAHADRLDHRRRPGQLAAGAPAAASAAWTGRKARGRLLAADLAAGRLRRRRPAAAGAEGRGQEAGALRGARRARRRRRCWIRGLLILTCTGVSFAHGSNDGQKGMGLIMLILIGVVPTAYALNRAPDPTRDAVDRGGLAGRRASARQAPARRLDGRRRPTPSCRAFLTTRQGDAADHDLARAEDSPCAASLDGIESIGELPAERGRGYAATTSIWSRRRSA